MSLSASFTLSLAPGDPLVPGGGRFDLSKTWTGDLAGSSHGVMLTAGDPATGSAGYVATEHFEGTLDGRRGTLALQQLGAMTGGEPELRYVIAPGSGTGDLEGVTGELTIEEIDDEGVHRVRITLG